MTNILRDSFETRVFSPSYEDGASVWNQVDTLLQRNDKFLDERPLQPKRAIQEYAAQNGIRVPKRFDSLEEALASGRKFIIRSEHPQEYAGISGLSESIVYDPKRIQKYLEWKTEEDLRKRVITEDEIISNRLNEGSEFNRGGRTWHMLDWTAERRIVEAMLARISYLPEKDILRIISIVRSFFFVSYASKMDLDVNDVLAEQSYTFWEYIEGINHTVVKDKDSDNKYYIISRGFFERDGEDRSYYDMIIVEDGDIIREWGWFYAKKSWTLSDGARWIEFKWIFNHRSLINQYERVRSLPKFDPNHCPIMEFQSWFEGKEYFLQYHRWSDINKKEAFVLDRELEEWEVELDFFRWTTSPEWIIVETWSDYIDDRKIKWWSYPICEEDASFDLHHDSIFSQIMTRRRKVQFGNFKNFDWLTMCLNSGHASIAEVFKSDMYVPVPDDFYKEIPFSKIRDISSSIWVPYKIKIRVISDGKRCFVKRLTTDEEIMSDHRKFNIPFMQRERPKEVIPSDKLTIQEVH